MDKVELTTLLDPTRYQGKHENRSRPILKMLALAGLPILWYVQGVILLAKTFPAAPTVVASVIVYMYYIWRLVAKILLNEKDRRRVYRERLYTKYDDLSKITTITDIYNDGCVEYSSGVGAYFLVFTAGNRTSDQMKSLQVSRFIDAMYPYTVDISMINEADSEILDNRYSNLFKKFKSRRVAKGFLDIIEYNKKHVQENSLIITMVFVVQGRFSEKKLMLDKIRANMNLLTSLPIFKSVKIANRAEVIDFLYKDARCRFDLENTLTAAYGKEKYYRNRVVAYGDEAVQYARDRADDLKRKLTSVEVNNQESGWMVSYENSAHK